MTAFNLFHSMSIAVVKTSMNISEQKMNVIKKLLLNTHAQKLSVNNYLSCFKFTFCNNKSAELGFQVFLQ